MVSLLESVEQMIVMAMRFENEKKGKKQNDVQEMLKQIKGMKESLTQHNMIDLISTINTSSEVVRAVLPVYIDFFLTEI